MRILMIGLDINPPWVEGIRNTVKSLSQNLIKHQHRVFVLTKGSNNQSDIEFIEGIKYYRIHVGRSTNDSLSGVYIFLAKLPIELIKVVKHEKIGIIHGHSAFPIFGIILSAVSKITGVKSVFTLYSSLDNKNKASNYPMIWRVLNFSKNKWLGKILSVFVDVIVVTSNVANKSLTSVGIDENKIKYVPTGIDSTFLKPFDRYNETKTKLNISSNKKIILFAGDITPWKGLDIFLKSISVISKKYPNILCIIMTKGIYKYEDKRKEEIDNLIKRNDIENFIYTIGQYPNIIEIYGISDIVVLPFVSLFSIMDIPLSLLEAIAMGKPVIATRVGGTPEIIEHKKNGMLVEPNNVDELVDAILYMLENENEAKRMGAKGAKLISEKFRVEVAVKELEKIYKRLGGESHYCSDYWT